jgi:hypothetical protein
MPLIHTRLQYSSGRYDYLKEIAFGYAFLLRELGIVLK